MTAHITIRRVLGVEEKAINNKPILHQLWSNSVLEIIKIHGIGWVKKTTIKLIKKGDSLFITVKAGTGKTTLPRETVDGGIDKINDERWNKKLILCKR